MIQLNEISQSTKSTIFHIFERDGMTRDTVGTCVAGLAAEALIKQGTITEQQARNDEDEETITKILIEANSNKKAYEKLVLQVYLHAVADDHIDIALGI